MRCLEPNWPAIAKPVALALLGDPNRKESRRHELRFGRRGSLAVDLRAARWFDHEAQEGGGLLDLIEREAGTDRAGAWEWLAAHGFAEPANDTAARQHAAAPDPQGPARERQPARRRDRREIRACRPPMARRPPDRGHAGGAVSAPSGPEPVAGTVRDPLV